MRTRTELALMARLAWPATLSFVSFSLMEVVDCAMLGTVSVESMAGVSLAATVLYVIMAFPINMLRALSPVAGQAAGSTGATRGPALASLARLAVGASVVLGSVAAFAALAASRMMPGFGYEAAMVGQVQTFLQWRAPFLPVDMIFLGTWALLEGLNDTRTPMVAGIVANLANVALNLILIPGAGPIPALGIAGAAIATNLSTLLGLAVIGCCVWKRMRLDTTKPFQSFLAPGAALSTGPGIDRNALRSFLRIGWPMGITGVIDLAGAFILGLLIARAGAVASATHGILSRLITLGLASANGISVATLALVARAIGGRDLAAARRRARLALMLQLGAGTLIGLLGLLGSRHWLLWVTSSAEVSSAGAVLLPLGAAILWFDGLWAVCASILEGAGRTRILMLTSLVFDLAAGIFLVLSPQASLETCYQVWLARSMLKTAFLFRQLPVDHRRSAQQLAPRVASPMPMWIQIHATPQGEISGSNDWREPQTSRWRWRSNPPPYG